MNKQQRQELSAIADRISPDEERLGAMSEDERKAYLDDLEKAKEDIESVRDDEQEKLDNMPDSLRDGSRGESIQEGIDNLEEAINHLENAIGEESVMDEEWVEEVAAEVDCACDILNNF